MAASLDKDGTDNNIIPSNEAEWLFVNYHDDYHQDDNHQPALNDYDDRPRKGKKGKYLKDWE